MTKELAAPAQVALDVQAQVAIEEVVRAVVVGRAAALKDGGEVFVWRAAGDVRQFRVGGLQGA